MRLVPFFLPGMGCPQKCVFCDQKAQTGTPDIKLEHALTLLQALLSTQERPFGLGIFGGTFTGLPAIWQERFLEQTRILRQSGKLLHLRVSTRPDCIDQETLTRLRAGGVDMVELGIQSFSTQVLRKSGRGYNRTQAVNACEAVRQHGFELGIQLLPGLPEHNAGLWREDVAQTMALRPSVVRIYPCVVIRDTPLGAMYARGEYVPWSLPLAVEETGWAILQFWKAKIQVIRLGLAAQPDMLDKLEAGPWHPAFGNMARSAALLRFLKELLTDRADHVRSIWIPHSLNGELWGHRRANAQALAHLGVTPERVHFWPEAEIGVELEFSKTSEAHTYPRHSRHVFR